MVAVSGALIFAGYQLLCYGWSQVNGSNAGFFDILWPGRYQGNTPDTGGAGGLSLTPAAIKKLAPLGGASGSPSPIGQSGYTEVQTPSGIVLVPPSGTTG